MAAIMLALACGPAPAPTYAQGRSAAQIVGDGSNALRSVGSAHVTIQSTFQGSAGEFDADIEDQNIKGTMTIGANKMNMIVYAGKFYIYGPDLLSFAHVTDPAVKANVSEKWIVVPSGLIMDQQSLQALGDFSGMADCVKSGAGFTKKGTSTIDGHPVVEVQNAAGDRNFVETAAPHYPIRIVYVASDQSCSSAGLAGGTIDLTQIGAHFEINAPPDSTDLASVGLSPGS